MKGKPGDPIGLTRDSEWQIGVRRTIPVSVEKLWEMIISKKGIAIWLGAGPEFKFQVGEEYILTDGTEGRIRVYHPYSHLRISRQPVDPSYDHPALIQIRILASGVKSVLAFHEEHLPSESERQKRKTFYLGVVDQIKNALDL